MNPDSSSFNSVLHEVDYHHCSRGHKVAGCFVILVVKVAEKFICRSKVNEEIQFNVKRDADDDEESGLH